MPKNTTHSSSDNKSGELNRWDQSPATPASGTRGTWPIHAATGPCDHENDGNAWIAFDRTGDFVFDEEHLYVGPEPLPRDNARVA